MKPRNRKGISAAALTLFAAFAITSCNNYPTNTENMTTMVANHNTEEEEIALPDEPIVVKESEPISTNYKPEQESTVTFDRFPVSYEDWARTQEQLGNSLAGTVALELMAMQLYYYNQKEGEKAIYQCNTDTDAKSLIRIISQKFKQSMTGNGDSYFCPFLVASYLKGATPGNAYHPVKPYEIKVRMHPSTRPQQGNISFTGIDYFLQIYCNGADTPWRGVEVAELKGEKHFRIFNNASLPVGVKQIAYKSNPEEFEELK